MKRVVFRVGGTVVLLLAAVLAMVFWGMQPTTGPQIRTYPSPRTAFLVIDIQEDFTGPHARKPYRDGDRIVAIANALLAQARAKGVLVVYVKNVVDNPIMSFFMGGLNAPGAPGQTT